jgi:hypothetical protein
MATFRALPGFGAIFTPLPADWTSVKLKRWVTGIPAAACSASAYRITSSAVA